MRAVGFQAIQQFSWEVVWALYHALSFLRAHQLDQAVVSIFMPAEDRMPSLFKIIAVLTITVVLTQRG
jgi:hypothetical protein